MLICVTQQELSVSHIVAQYLVFIAGPEGRTHAVVFSWVCGFVFFGGEKTGPYTAKICPCLFF
jgi:hypothetical protein